MLCVVGKPPELMIMERVHTQNDSGAVGSYIGQLRAWSFLI